MIHVTHLIMISSDDQLLSCLDDSHQTAVIRLRSCIRWFIANCGTSVHDNSSMKNPIAIINCVKNRLFTKCGRSTTYDSIKCIKTVRYVNIKNLITVKIVRNWSITICIIGFLNRGKSMSIVYNIMTIK